MSKFCAKCGANLAANSGFCPLCGFAANAKLPLAPVKKVEQPQPSEPSPQPQKTKKNPLGIIPIIIAGVSTFVAIILLVILLIPDNKCDFCGEKADGKAKFSETVVKYCDDCYNKCMLCGKDATHLGEIASGKFVFMCNKCQNYIDSNKVAGTDETTNEPSDGFFAGESDNNNINIPEPTEKPDTTQGHTNPEGETATKPSNISGGDNNISNSATTTKTSSDVTSQTAKETTTKAKKVNYETDGKLIYKDYEIKVNTFDSQNKNATFKIISADSEFKEDGITIHYRALDENKKPIDSESSVYAEFKDGKISSECVIAIPDGTATIQFFTKSKNNNA